MVSCLVRATRCLSALENNLNTLQDLPASLLCTRVQVRSRAWDRSNFALQGALRGSSKESIKLPNGRQIASALSAAVQQCCSSILVYVYISGVSEAWTVWALRFESGSRNREPDRFRSTASALIHLVTD